MVLVYIYCLERPQALCELCKYITQLEATAHDPLDLPKELLYIPVTTWLLVSDTFVITGSMVLDVVEFRLPTRVWHAAGKKEGHKSNILLINNKLRLGYRYKM
jgi:hypothetical protein